MNSNFNIVTPGAVSSRCSLLMEISLQGISYIIINEDSACVAMAMYHFDSGTTNDQLANYLQDIVAEQSILQQSFKKTTIIYAFITTVLVPHDFMNLPANKSMLELVYGDTSESIIHTNFIYKQNLHTVYMVPKQIDAVIAHLFSQANHLHQYSLLPNVVEATGNLLYCIFTPTNVTVQLFKLGKLQIIQNFEYKVPEDVVYHLLNVCAQFEVAVNDTIVYLNGMINADSTITVELHNYFLHYTFSDLPLTFTYNEEIKKYPEHYFSHLFQLAACV